MHPLGLNDAKDSVDGLIPTQVLIKEKVNGRFSAADCDIIQ